MLQTNEAKVKLQAQPQRVPGAGKGMQSGAAQWFAEGTGKRAWPAVSVDGQLPLQSRGMLVPYRVAVIV